MQHALWWSWGAIEAVLFIHMWQRDSMHIGKSESAEIGSHQVSCDSQSAYALVVCAASMHVCAHPPKYTREGAHCAGHRHVQRNRVRALVASL
jgi:hypothetical protein